MEVSGESYPLKVKTELPFLYILWKPWFPLRSWDYNKSISKGESQPHYSPYFEKICCLANISGNQ